LGKQKVHTVNEIFNISVPFNVWKAVNITYILV